MCILKKKRKFIFVKILIGKKYILVYTIEFYGIYVQNLSSWEGGAGAAAATVDTLFN